MGNNGDNKDNGFDEIRDLLNKHYKSSDSDNTEEFWDRVSKKIDSLYHRELFSENCTDSEKNILSDEERYYLGLEEYVNNKVHSLKHKKITEHLLSCKQCMTNYIELLDKKKEVHSTKINFG